MNLGPDVRGVGVGRARAETRGRFRRTSSDLGGLCLKVVVETKPSNAKFPLKTPVRKRFTIARSGGVWRVATDVTTLGRRIRLDCSARVQRGWPEAAMFLPGRTFAACRGDEAGAPPDDEDSATARKIVRVGTVGALLVDADDERVYLVTAGHVVTRPCKGELDVARDTYFSAWSVDWTSRSEDDFPTTSTEMIDGSIEDVLIVGFPRHEYPVPSMAAEGAATWPPGFRGELTSTDDEREALQGKGGWTAFVWSQRVRQRDGDDVTDTVTTPVELESTYDRLPFRIGCGSTLRNVVYANLWRYVFTGVSTIPGDSGAAVYLTRRSPVDARVETKLLGFHFAVGEPTGALNDPDGECHGYCVDASTFLDAQLTGGIGELGRRYRFCGL